MEYVYDFGNRIKQLRRKRGITQDRLAKTLGVTGANVSKYENNIITPPVEILCCMADYFGVSMDAMCGREEKGSLSLVGLSEEQTSFLRELYDAFNEQNNNKGFRYTEEKKYKILGKIAEYIVKNSSR